MTDAILTTASIQRVLLLGGCWTILAAAWIAACVWVDRDARYVFGSETWWPLVMAAPGVGLVVSAAAWGFAGLPALLAVTAAIGGVYLWLRETSVSLPHRVLTMKRARALLRATAARLPPGRAFWARRGRSSAASGDEARGGAILLRRDGSRPPAIPPGRRHRRAARADRVARDIVAEALTAAASEVSIEPRADGRVRMRLRIDGVMTGYESVDGVQGDHLRDAFRSFAGLESPTPAAQRGGFTATVAGRTVDVGVTTARSQLTLHLTDPGGCEGADFRGGIEAIGVSRQHADSIRWAVLQPAGLLLVCGPSESGKTTTAYAVIGEIDPRTHRVATVEDAVAHPLPSVSQTAVDAAAGLTAARLLRAAAGQDAAAILVDEIRDQETAAVAVQTAASRTVIATLQAEDAADAIVKLLGFGVTPEQLRTSVAVVVAQRLVRVLCEHCKKRSPAPADFLEKLGHRGAEEVVIYKKRGCAACRGIGYRGRVPVQEVLLVGESLRQLPPGTTSRTLIRAEARRAGMTTLRESAVALVSHGVTSIKEVVRCVP